jgi:hypothetical protein
MGGKKLIPAYALSRNGLPGYLVLQTADSLNGGPVLIAARG